MRGPDMPTRLATGNAGGIYDLMHVSHDSYKEPSNSLNKGDDEANVSQTSTADPTREAATQSILMNLQRYAEAQGHKFSPEEIDKTDPEFQDSLSENVPCLKPTTAIGFSSFERVMMNTENPKYHRVSKEVLTHIEEKMKGWGEFLGEPRDLYGDGAVGICGMPLCDAAAKTLVGYNTPDLTLGHCVVVLDELLPVCKKCAVKFKRTNAEDKTLNALVQLNAQNAERRAQNALQNPEPSPEPRGDDVETEVVLTQGELLRVVKHQEYVAGLTSVQCYEMLKNRQWMMTQQMARDAEMAQLRTQLAERDAQIQDLEDEWGDLEEQLRNIIYKLVLNFYLKFSSSRMGLSRFTLSSNHQKRLRNGCT
jgi:hypothetical protein